MFGHLNRMKERSVVDEMCCSGKYPCSYRGWLALSPRPHPSGSSNEIDSYFPLYILTLTNPLLLGILRVDPGGGGGGGT